MQASTIAIMLLLCSNIQGSDAIVISEYYKTGSYEFTGTVSTDMGTFKGSHAFSGKVSAGEFYCSWINDLGFMKMKGDVKINADGGVMKMDGASDQKYADPMMAVAAATGVSGGSAHVMYSLWRGDIKMVLPINVTQTLKNDKMLTVLGSDDNGSRLTEVDIVDGMVVEIRSSYDPSKDNGKDEEMTDDQMKEVLKAMGKEINEAELNALKNTLKHANDVKSKTKDKIISKTLIKVIKSEK